MEDVGRFEGDYRLQDGPRQRAVADLAARQHGVVAHWQLIELGRMMRRRPARTADTVRSLLSAAAAAR
jgi:hypothetical protein